MIRTSVTNDTQRDAGSILPLVLVFTVVLAMVVVALATYASSTLRLGQAAERSSDRLASANGAMDSALEDLERGVGPCLLFGQDYTVTDVVNDMSPEVDCTWVGGRFNVGDLFAVVMTGAGAGRTGPLLTVTNGGNSANAQKVFEGPVYMAATPTPSGANPTLDFGATLEIKNADLSYSSTDCGSVTPSLPNQLTISPVGYGTQCYEEPWDDPEMFGAFLPAEPAVTNTTAFPARRVPRPRQMRSAVGSGSRVRTPRPRSWATRATTTSSRATTTSTTSATGRSRVRSRSSDIPVTPVPASMASSPRTPSPTIPAATPGRTIRTRRAPRCTSVATHS